MPPGSFDETFHVEHATIPSNRTFEDTRCALEASLPTIDSTYQTLLVAGDIEGARRALQNLPVLNNFIVPPRNFGSLLKIFNHTGKAVQYEIGNPYTASRMNAFDLGVALYTPIRVLLREKDGVVQFEYDRPRSTMAQFENEGVNAVARDLDRNLTALLVGAGGWN